MRRFTARLRPLLAAGLAAWLAGVAPTPAAAERVAVRAHDHGAFGRVAFEWPAPIAVEGLPGPDELTLRFARPFDGDLRVAADRLQPYLHAATRGTEAGDVVLRLRPGTRSRVFTVGDRIVAVDLFRGEPDIPAVRVRTGRHGESARIVFDLPFAAAYDVERADDRVTVRFDRPARIDAAAIARDLAPLVAGAGAGSDAGASWVTLRVPPGARLHHFALPDNRVVVDLSPPPAREPEPPVQPAARPAPAVAPPARSATGPPSLTAASEGVAGGAELRFDWSLPVAAAVFVRAGHLWTVFAAEPADSAGAVPALAAAAADVLEPGEVVAAEGGLALRFPLRRQVEPAATRDGGLWRVTLRDGPSPPRPLEPRRLADPPRLFFPGAGTVVRLTDPEIGDRLHVLPLLESGRGHRRARGLVELRLLATAQGIAWQPLADGLVTRAVEGGVQLGAPGGLRLTVLPDRGRTERALAVETDPNAADAVEVEPAQRSSRPATAAVGPTGPDPPLGLAAGTLDSGEAELAQRRRLLRRVVSAPPERRDAARLDLARFLLTRTLAGEALAVLGAVAPEPGSDAATAAARDALAGAAQLLMGRTKEAEAGLTAPALAGDQEAALWHAMLAAAENDWRRAARELERSGRTLASYPAPLRARLGTTAALIALEAERPEVAHAVLDGLRDLDLSPHERARLRFTEGLALARDGAPVAAERTWRELAATAPAETRHKADYALTALLLEAGRIDPDDAVARLEAGRPFWRGHPWEATMLDGLARVYAERRDYRRALATHKEALSRHPEAPETGRIAEAMNRLFVAALTAEDDGAPSALEVLALHRDYPELMPSGDVGDRLTRRLAERLADMDLIEDAAALVERQVRHRLRGVPKAEAGAYLGELRLRQPAPEAALDALRASATAAPLPAELHQRRRLVEARALAAQGRGDEALDALDGDRGREAQLLRAAIHFDRRAWPRVVETIDGLLRGRADPDAPLDREERELVVRLALARAQMEDWAGLRALRERFGAAVAGSPEHPAFVMATGGEPGADDARTVLAGSAAQVDAVRALLDPGLGG